MEKVPRWKGRAGSMDGPGQRPRGTDLGRRAGGGVKRQRQDGYENVQGHRMKPPQSRHRSHTHVSDRILS